MPWQCRLIDREEVVKTSGKLRPGDMWFVPDMLDPKHDGYYLNHILSPEYKRDWLGKRAPIIVVLPDGNWFNVDSLASGSDHGWTVAGEPPNITVSPSINLVGSYHGFLRNGELTEDVEGRKFEP